MHRVVDRVGAEERDPEVELAHRVIQHPPGDFRIPMVDRTEDDQDRRHRHHHVEVGDDEHRAGKRDVHGHVAQEQAGQATVDEREDEADGEEHRDREMDVPAPQRQHPVVDLERRGNGDDQRGRGEEEAEVRIHSADVHVVRPHDEAQAADRQNGPDHHPIAEDVLARIDADEIGDNSKCRQRDDVHLGVAEEPEEVLEQDRAAAVVAQVLALGDQGRHEETRAQRLVERHHDCADEQGGKREQREDGGHEDAPHRQRQTHHRHAARTPLQHGHDVVEPAHREADDEERERNEHQDDSPIRPRGSRQNGLRRIQGPARAGGAAGHEEARHQQQHSEQIDPVAHHVDIGEHHVARADHQRNEVVAEASQEQRGEQVDHHDHAVHRDVLQVGGRRDEREHVRETELQPHDSRQHQRHQPHGNRGDRVLNGDDLGVLAPDVFADEGLRMVELRLRDFGWSNELRLVMRYIGHCRFLNSSSHRCLT